MDLKAKIVWQFLDSCSHCDRKALYVCAPSDWTWLCVMTLYCTSFCAFTNFSSFFAILIFHWVNQNFWKTFKRYFRKWIHTRNFEGVFNNQLRIYFFLWSIDIWLKSMFSMSGFLGTILDFDPFQAGNGQTYI